MYKGNLDQNQFFYGIMFFFSLSSSSSSFLILMVALLAAHATHISSPFCSRRNFEKNYIYIYRNLTKKGKEEEDEGKHQKKREEEEEEEVGWKKKWYDSLREGRGERERERRGRGEPPSPFFFGWVPHAFSHKLRKFVVNPDGTVVAPNKRQVFLGQA